jgi:predicted GH43/DUF377 family glycosyl hydrolase
MELKRYERNPILLPNPDNNWESKAVFNPGAVYIDEKIYLLYRAIGEYKNYISRLGLAISDDGFNFKRVSNKPVLKPEYDYEKWGCEDPRINLVENKIYLTYTSLNQRAYGLKTISRIALAATSDWYHFQKMGLISNKVADTRNTVIFPEKINGKYIMLHRPHNWIKKCIKKTKTKFEINLKGKWVQWPGNLEKPDNFPEKPSIWLAYSDDLIHWSEHQLLYSPTEKWESVKIGPGAPPIKTSAGWLLIYHGINDEPDFPVKRFDGKIQTRIYRAGALLLDFNDPTKIIARTKKPILEPETDYEIYGDVPKVVFPTGAFVKDNQLFIYYGAADKSCCLVTTKLDKLIKELMKNASNYS